MNGRRASCRARPTVKPPRVSSPLRAHEEEMARLKKRYKREALAMCERKFQEGVAVGQEPVDRGARSIAHDVARWRLPSQHYLTDAAKRGASEAALVSKISAKLRSKYKKEAIAACEKRFQEGRAEGAAEAEARASSTTRNAIADAKRALRSEFKQAVVDAKAEADREQRRRRQLQDSTDRILATKDDEIDRLRAELSQARTAPLRHCLTRPRRRSGALAVDIAEL